MFSNFTVFPSREQFHSLAGEHNLIPVYSEIFADLETPVSVYAKAFGGSNSCLLESVEGNARLARYSFIAGDPFLTIRTYGKEVVINRDGQVVKEKGHLTAMLREILNQYRAVQHSALPRFSGGLVGYIGYDCVRLFEDLPHEPPDDSGLPDACLMMPESVIVFDHYTSKLKIVINARVDSHPDAAYDGALEKISLLREAMDRPLPGRENTAQGGQNLKAEQKKPKVKHLTDRADFCASVEKVKKHIVKGDILQAVISQRFAVSGGAEPFKVYRALRSLNPSPYMYFLNFDELKIAGASPEMLVRLEGGVVESRPIAGTRPRGRTAEEELQLEEELRADPKEQAEHVMLVDLGRNDLGRVSRYGSVEVPVFMSCEKYSHVMHLVSEVRGELAAGRDAFDALEACFPAGTVSGAPKVRAMEIIDELEPGKRGPYAGAVGYFTYSGSMDTCITIRTLVFTKGMAYAQAGAGIVADSQADREYEETISKARVLIKALEIAGEGLS